MDNQISVNSIIAKKERELLLFLQANREVLRTGDNSSFNYDNFISLEETIEDNFDIWLIFEKAGKSLNSLMSRIKGEFLGNERIYLIQKGKFMQHLFANLFNFKEFFKTLLNLIDILSNKLNIIHSDIKPDNLLIDYDYDEENKKINYKSFKLIDFGSAYFIDNPENFASNTPEYMSPEITDLIEKNASNKDVISFLKKLKNWPSAIDIWSLGVMILEMIVCCPLWMNYKAKVVIRGKVNK
jgi:serine/threonine protein kinase